MVTIKKTIRFGGTLALLAVAGTSSAQSAGAKTCAPRRLVMLGVLFGSGLAGAESGDLQRNARPPRLPTVHMPSMRSNSRGQSLQTLPSDNTVTVDHSEPEQLLTVKTRRQLLQSAQSPPSRPIRIGYFAQPEMAVWCKHHRFVERVTGQDVEWVPVPALKTRACMHITSEFKWLRACLRM